MPGSEVLEKEQLPFSSSFGEVWETQIPAEESASLPRITAWE